MAPSPTGSAVEEPGAEQQVEQAYSNLPLSFEANQGQTDAQVDFLARTGGQTLFLTPDRAMLSLAGDEATGRPESAVAMRIVGASSSASTARQEPLPGKVNYLAGKDPATHRTNIPTYGRVGYSGVYPGIDVAYYGNNGQLEYDFVVAPGADPKAIGLSFEGADGVRINDGGDLVVSTPGGKLTHAKPFLYQDVKGQRQPVAGRFTLHDGQVGFAVDSYDRSRPLVIDPVLSYSTYLGGSGVDLVAGMALDQRGAVYVTGNTRSPNFPTTPGALKTTPVSPGVFVTKLTKGLIEYSTFVGGSGGEPGAGGIAVDADGSAWVAGTTVSTDFPVTPGAYQTVLPSRGSSFVAKLAPDGSSLLYGTYLGNTTGTLQAQRPTVDRSGDVYLSLSQTDAPVTSAFPTTPGAVQATCTPQAGNPGVCSNDAILARLRPGGDGPADIVHATYLGGSGFDNATAISIDATGVVYLLGLTRSSDFPTTPGAFRTSPPSATGNNSSPTDLFVAKVRPSGNGPSDLLYATYLGGAQEDGPVGNDLALGPDDTVYVTGSTSSPDFPTTPGAFRRSLLTNPANHPPAAVIQWPDAFLTKLRTAGTGANDLVYSTYLGAQGRTTLARAIAVDGRGYAFISGDVSDTIPTRNPLPCCASKGATSARDAFVAAINPAGSGESDLVFSTYLGGSAADDGADLGIGQGRDGRARSLTLVGRTSSANFPVTQSAAQGSLGGSIDGFVSKVDLSDLLCTRTVTGDVRGRLIVGPGEEVCLSNASVFGGITVRPGGALSARDSRVAGSIDADGAIAFRLCGVDVAGNVTVTNTPDYVDVDGDGCKPSRISGRTVGLTNS